VGCKYLGIIKKIEPKFLVKRHFFKLKTKPCKRFKSTKWRSYFVLLYYLFFFKAVEIRRSLLISNKEGRSSEGRVMELIKSTFHRSL
jgi:hypothetical protein